MKNRKSPLVIVFASLLVLCTNLVHADVKLTDPLPLSPELHRGKLPNGLTYYIQKNSRPANKVEMRLVVKVGSIMEDPDQLGLAHFTEHMAFNGTTHFEKNKLINFLQDIGVKFGADLNAYTSFDETVYILPIPTDRPDNLDKGMQVLADWAGGLTFAGDEIEHERGVVLEESRLGKGADDRMNKILLPKIFAGSKYAERLPIGKDETLRTFKHAAIKRFYHDWYRPDLMAVVLVGDIEPKKAEEMVRRYFGKLKNPAKERARVYAPVPDRAHEEAVVVTDREATNNVLRITYSQSPEPPDLTLGDYRQTMVQNLFNSMLGMRIQEMTQAANPPFVAGGGGVGNFVRGYKQYSAVALLGKGGAAPAIDALVQENARLAQFGFTAQELERGKKSMLRNIENAYNEREKTESGSLAAEFIRNFLVQESVPGIAREFDFMKTLMPTISLDEVNRYAKATAGEGDKKLVVYQGVAGDNVAEPTADALLAGVKAAAVKTVAAYSEAAVASSLMEKAPQGGQIVAERSNAALGLTELTLGNGVKVVLKATDFKNDQVLMTAVREGGQSLFPDQDFHNAQYAPFLVREMGLASFSPTDLRKMLAGKTANVAPYLADLREGLNGQSGSADIETMLQMTHLYFTQPRTDPALFQSFISKQQDFTKNLMARPETVFQDDVLKTIYNGHPRAPRVPKPGDFEKISLDRTMAIYKDRFSSAKGYTFFFVGSFDVAKMKALVANYIGTLPTPDVPTAFKDTGLRPVKGVVKQEERLGSEQKSVISLTFSGDAPYSTAEQLRLAATLEVLNIRFNDILREQMGAVYGARAVGALSKDPYGHYQVSMNIPCGPENVDKLIAAVMQELKTLKDNGAQPGDLLKVKEGWIKSYREGMRSNSYWMGSLANSHNLGEDPARILTYEARVNALTAADVKAAANTYFDLRNYVQVVLYPEKKL
jgi:zinc protease